MKIYLIAGKHYAASGDDLYEKVPEFAANEEIPVIVSPAVDSPKKVTPKKQARHYVPKKGYKKGTCGKCGKEGHSAWHCPERSLKKKAIAAKKEEPKRKGKYDPDEVVTLARRVANKDLTSEQAAEKLGVNKAMWYYLRNKYAAGAVAKQKPEQKEVLNADEIREKVTEMQEQGMTSLRIAQQLHVPLSTVNRYWIHDRLAPPSDEDIPEAVEKPVEEEEETL